LRRLRSRRLRRPRERQGSSDASGRWIPVTRGLRLLSLIAGLGLAAVPAAAADIQLTPVKRLSFPDRAYIVDVGRDADLAHDRMHVFENGAAVNRFTIQPLASSSIDSGVVLAIDASKSMAGPPARSAI